MNARCRWLPVLLMCVWMGTQVPLTFLSAADPQSAELTERLTPLIEKHKGRVAVAVKHLETGVSFTHRGDEPMPTASLIKFPVMVEAYRQAQAQQLDLAEMVTLKDEDKVPGSGILTSHFSAGTTISLRDAIRLMIAYSDNTATNLVLTKIGLSATGETMRNLGFPETRIHAQVFRAATSIDPERSKKFGLGSTTASEMLRLFEQLHARKLVAAEASDQMLAHLTACEDKEKLTRFLPAGTRVAHKTGSVSAVRCDAGIIFSPLGAIAVCVLTSENEDQRWVADNAGNVLCAEIGRAVFRHFNPENSKTPDGKVLEIGTSGTLVEALQRTLNARLEPSPGLSVDGEFGTATQSAVIRFQQARKLEASGQVGKETWDALGTLVTEDPPVPDPEVVNTQVLDRSPADLLTGPPPVTARAWAIADGRTGHLVWGGNASARLEPASTTKIMTAHVVLSLAERTPALLDEEVVMSEEADATIGSTSGIRAGERLPLRELLFGLMLPSGNDAARALAEHCGSRCTAQGEAAAEGGNAPFARFVAEMNRTAAELGMRETHYENPHGLSHPEHLTSARDLLRLSRAAQQNPLFCEIVNTRQHGAKVSGPGGYTRNVVWKNTNELLGITGYSGVKTGTTNPAGACLVARGVHGDDILEVVVLGARATESRYTDTRNLFRWAWTERGQGR